MLKDNLTPLVPISATDPFHVSTLSTRIQQLISRDEELASLLAGVSASISVVDVTSNHELEGARSVGKRVTSGWLTRVPAYYRDGIWNSPSTFADSDAENEGRAIVYPSDPDKIVYGTTTQTYTLHTSGGTVNVSPRNSIELQYGTPDTYPPSANSRELAVGRMFDGSTAYAFKYLDPAQSWKWVPDNSQQQIYVKKADTSIISLNSVLPNNLGEYFQVIPCADQRHILICTCAGGNGSASDKWFLVEYTGTTAVLVGQGNVTSSIMTSRMVGYSDQLGSHAIGMLESDLKTLWVIYCAGTTKVDLFEISDLGNLQDIGPFPYSYGASTYFTPGVWFPAIHADNGICNVVFNNKTLKMSRLPHQAYNTSSNYIEFNGTTSLISTTDNLSQFNFGSGDFCIEVILEAGDTSAYKIIETDLWSISVSSANPGPGVVTVTCPGTQLDPQTTLIKGRPVSIVWERYNGVSSLYIDGWKKHAVSNATTFNTPSYLRVGGDSPRFLGKLYACRITTYARYKGEYQINELLSGVGDSRWADTKFLLKMDSAALYKRRELLDSRGLLPVGWEIVKVSTGIFTVTHDLGTSSFSVIPMSFTSGVKITTSNYTSTSFQVNTFSINGSSFLDSDFSCMVFLG